MDKKEFTERDNWWGGPCYELNLEFWPQGDSRRLLRALQAVWLSPTLEGPWTEPAHFGGPVELPSSPHTESSSRLFGVLKLANNIELACCSSILSIAEEDGTGSDWLSVFIYHQMLVRAFGFDATSGPRMKDWVDLVNHAYIQIAEATYVSAGFDFGVVGFKGILQSGQKGPSPLQVKQGGLLLPPSYRTAYWNIQSMSSIALPSGVHWLESRR